MALRPFCKACATHPCLCANPPLPRPTYEELVKRVAELERNAHEPFDFTHLIERLDRLERDVAAAPDLLAALQNLLTWKNGNENVPPRHNGEEPWLWARAAIKKATDQTTGFLPAPPKEARMASEKAMEKAKEFWNSVPVAAPKEEWLELYASALDAAREEALEEAAKVAGMACLVPPDGGEPTDAERGVAEQAARNIRSLKSPGHREG